MLGWIALVGFSFLGSVLVGVADYCDEQDRKKDKRKLYDIIKQQNDQIDELIKENSDLKLESWKQEKANKEAK